MIYNYTQFLLEKDSIEEYEELNKKLERELNFTSYDISIIKELLKSGANPDLCFKTAIQSGDEILLQLAIDYDADLNNKSNQFYPLEILLKNNKLSAFHILIQTHKININHLNDTLIVAIKKNNIDIFQTLIKKGANDPEAYIAAINNDDLKLVEYLYSKKFVITDDVFKSAIDSEKEEFYNFFYEKGYKIPEKDKEDFLMKVNNKKELIFLIDKMECNITKDLIEEGNVKILNYLCSYKFQKWFLDTCPNRCNEILSILIPKIKKEYENFLIAVESGFI